MEILPVNDAATAKFFLNVAPILHKDDPSFIRPLDKDINDVFDPKKNKTFRHGEVQRWILKDDAGKPIGRIAAFTNKKYKNKGDEVPVGCMGFFEGINDQDAADLLLDNAKHWLLSKGMEAMDGPVNFGERDRWWGMVTEGFYEPLYCMNYNPPYYQQLVENYGFKLFYNQVCFAMKPKAPFDPKIWRRYETLAKDVKFSATHLDKANLKKFAEDFTVVYNKAWAGHGGLKSLSLKQVEAMFRQMKPVMDEKIIWFAYYDKNPIAIFVNIPDLNQWFKHLNGKFDLLHKLYFLWLKKFRKNTKFTGLVFGVIPEWQGKGVDGYIIGAAGKMVQSDRVPYTFYEMQWIGDFNPKMINVAKGIGNVSASRNLVTYRYLFDSTREFKRHPVLI